MRWLFVVATLCASSGCDRVFRLEPLTPVDAMGDSDGDAPDMGSSSNLRIATGARHTCATVQGRLNCWGDGDQYQLGRDSTSDLGLATSPRAAGDIGTLYLPIQVAAGNAHTCALATAGTVHCWGNSDSGQLGYASTNTVPVANTASVDLGGAVSQIAAAGDHTCAILNNGALRCWGRNDRGQLGNGSTVAIGDDESPSVRPPVALDMVSQLALGDLHTCALSGGQVYCWGAGTDGRLGYGNQQDRLAPTDPVPIGATEGITQIAAGSRHTCALTMQGQVHCWGVGDLGQLGYGLADTIGDDELPSSRGAVGLGGIALQIAAGGDHTCAILATGETLCWGYGANGALGTGMTTNVGDNETLDINPRFVELPGAATALQLALGHDHSCAVTSDDEISCWGLHDDGRLGYGNAESIGDNEAVSTAGYVDVF